MIDEWTEAIPERATTTSVTFHYDAPAQRPPQTICLAVNPGLAGEAWSGDALVRTINELFDLARLRLLTPADIPGAGTMLPTTFMPHNASEELPSLAVTAMTAEVSDVQGILGKY